MVGKILLAFGGGMLSFLSPCVLPLVPGYLSMMSGVGSSQLAVATRTDTRKLLRATLLFVAGFTLVFTALGAGASAVGGLLLEHQRGLNQIAGGLIVLMGLFIAGVVHLPGLMRERRFAVLPDSLGVFGPPVMGMAFAFGWTPCIGPILATVLSTAATEATLLNGVVLLVAYSLGLGVPFVIAGVAFGRLAGVFGWVKRHYTIINLVAGLMLAAFGVVMLTNNVGEVSSFIQRWLDRLGLDFLTNI
ncbi:MAG: cytochrome c biogenesis CcdA family protein [Acidimicrobiales bacterium]